MFVVAAPGGSPEDEDARTPTYLLKTTDQRNASEAQKPLSPLVLQTHESERSVGRRGRNGRGGNPGLFRGRSAEERRLIAERLEHFQRKRRLAQEPLGQCLVFRRARARREDDEGEVSACVETKDMYWTIHERHAEI